MFKQIKPNSNFGKQNSIFKNQKNVFFNFPKTNIRTNIPTVSNKGNFIL
jgi:hypothetical protein